MSNYDNSDFDEEGWALDDMGLRYGHCNSCGEERQEFEDCCDDGEVWPYEGEAVSHGEDVTR